MKRLFSPALALLGVLFFLASCAKDPVENGNVSSNEDYAKSFSNRKEVKVNISSQNEGAFYAVYYEFPYNETGDLVADYALCGRTPIDQTISVPTHVKKLYILGEGVLKIVDTGDIAITKSGTRASTAISSEVLTNINSIYFPEAKYNFRHEDLYKCTDLVITDVEAAEEFETAQAWITFVGDGGFNIGGGWGRIWAYTYPSEKLATLTLDDCTFYGVVNGEVVQVAYSEIKNNKKHIFYSKDELATGSSSFRKVALGEFPKGVNIGFVFRGNTESRFTTPNLNELLAKAVIKYPDNTSFTITNGKVSCGFIQHIALGEFEGNILGMENRLPGQGGYDGDYNDMLCLVETNPVAIKPHDDVTPPDVNPATITEGLYLFEDNYPWRGDYDFNDVVIQYKISDYYTTPNKQKDVQATLLANGAKYNNTFGFFNLGTNQYTPMLADITGYDNVMRGQTYKDLGKSAVATFYGDIKPYLYNGSHYVFENTVNDNDKAYPYVLEIPLTANYQWSREFQSIELAYPKYLLWRSGQLSDGVWYVDCDENYVFKR